MERATERRLTRSRGDRMICGVAGGLAEHLGIDASIVRIAFVLATLCGGVGVIAYVALCLLVPEAPSPEPDASRS